MRRVSKSIFSILFLSILSILAFTGCTFFDRSEVPTTSTVESTPVPTAQVSLETINQSNEVALYDISIAEGSSVYELLNQTMVDNQNFTVAFDAFEIDGNPAFFVSEINGYNPTSENKFWSFYVNDELSSVGISDYKPKTGDKITFKVESIN